MNKMKKHNRGFALIEVLISVLILSVGAIGFLKLQSIGLNNSRGNYSRSEGLELVSSMAEFLRSNSDYQLSGKVEKSALKDILGAGTDDVPLMVIEAKPAGSYNFVHTAGECADDAQMVSCLTKLFSGQKSFIGDQIARNFAPGNAVLCVLIDPVNRRSARFDFVWRDKNNSVRTALSKDACPKGFGKEVTDGETNDLVQNWVTIYAEI